MRLVPLSARRCNTSECIKVFPKGVILGRGVCSRLGLKEGDYVGVFCAPDRKGDLYIGPASSVKGYQLHRRGQQYHLNSRELAKLILTETNITPGESALFRVGESFDYDGMKVLPIISRINYAHL